MTHHEFTNVAPYLHLAMLSQVARQADQFDIMHSHVDHWTFPFLDLVRTPIVTTMHGRLDWDILPPILACYPEAPLVSISMAQRNPVQEIPLTWAGCVYNGISLDHFRFHEVCAGRRYPAAAVKVLTKKPTNRQQLLAQLSAAAGISASGRLGYISEML
jgi:hypothetical protein